MNQDLWIEKENQIVTVGLSPKLQDEAGDISYLNMVEVGRRVKEDDSLFNLEASKAAIEVPSPLEGLVVEVNQRALENPSLLNSTDPKDNWVLKLQVEND